MYPVSEQFITAIKNNARYIKCFFTNDGLKYEPVKISIENNIYKTSADGDSFVGTFIGKSGTIKIRANDKLQLENRDIDLHFGIVLLDGSVEYVPYGTFRVYEKTNDVEYKICDHKILFNEIVKTFEIPYPSTPKSLAEWACSKVGVQVLFPEDFPNEDLAIPSEIFFGYDATYANIVEAISQATCTFAQINREGKLEFKWFAHVNFKIETNNMPKGSLVIKESLDRINTVVLAREPQNDNVYWPAEVDGERHEFKISNNPILDIDRYTSILDIFKRMNEFSYIPISVGTQGFFHLDAGDIVKLQTKENEYIDMLVMNQTLSYSGGISSQLDTPGTSKTMINYAAASSVKSRILKTELEVDKVKGTIISQVERIDNEMNRLEDGVDQLDTRVASAEQQITPEQITNTVSGSFYQKNETDQKYSSKEELSSEIKQLKDSIDITLKEMSGFNFIYNSSGWNSTNFWYGDKNGDGSTTPIVGRIEGIKNNDTSDNTVSGSAFHFEEGYMRQDVRLTPGNKYTISCKMKKYMTNCFFKVVHNGVETILFEFDNTYTDEAWHAYSTVFECLSSTVTIYISSSAKSMMIADIMLNDGEIEKTWTSNNDEIYTGSVKIDKSGIRISQSGTGTETIIDANEFAVVYARTGKKVVRVNKDTTVLQKVLAEDDLSVGNVKMIKRDNGLDIALIEE